jgi:Glyoxalase superfamily protein
MDEQIIPILHVANAAKAAGWYKRIGFEKQWEHRFEPHLPVFACVARDAARIYLSEHSGGARPGTLVYLWVRDVSAIAKDFQVEIRKQPWAHEIELQDPDGNRPRIGTTKA